MGLAGHEFLASLGKTRLRPGGRAGTDFLLDHCPIDADTRVLEVACNRGQSMIEVAARFGCQVTGVDRSAAAVTQAVENIADVGLASYCHPVQGDALALPYADASFDVVINEAMLTMLAPQERRAALREYARVLVPGGYLLTHDVAVREDAPALARELAQAIHHPAYPATQAQWHEFLAAAGFAVAHVQTGEMTLMSPLGLVKDEGALQAAQIIRNGMRAENRAQFMAMREFFMQHRSQLRYIAMVSVKA